MSFPFVIGYRIDVRRWRVDYIAGEPGGIAEQLWSMDLDVFLEEAWAFEDALREARQWANLMTAMRSDGASVDLMETQLRAMGTRDAPA